MKKQSNCQSWTRSPKLIGRGSFGHVSLAVNNSDGRVFAVKSVELGASRSHPAQVEALENEIRILRSFSSSGDSYVVGFLGDDVSHEPMNRSYRNLHLEYLSGGTVTDVASFSRRVTDVDEKILRWQVRCLVSSLKFVHDRGIVHCDVKGKNVLVGSDHATVKLADFGSAMEPGKMSGTIVPRGSPLWMAPEVIRRESQGPASDVWSVGCTVVEMVTCKPAWEEDRGFETLRRIGFSDELPTFPTRLSELGRDFLEKCLRRDPDQRWSCDQLLEHPFVATAVAPPSEVAGVSPRCVLDFSDHAEFDSSGSSGS